MDVPYFSDRALPCNEGGIIGNKFRQHQGDFMVQGSVPLSILPETAGLHSILDEEPCG
jgi:hypothetical protein